MTTQTVTQLLTDLIEESHMTDENKCPCCLPLINIELSSSQLEDLIEAIQPDLLPLLEKRLETVSRKF